MTLRTSLPSWQILEQTAKKMESQSIAAMFANDSDRFSKLSVCLPGLLFDYSKQNVTTETMSSLFALAKECDLQQWRDKMFAGERINITEDRSVLHVALRDFSGNDLIVEGENLTEKVNHQLAKMKRFCEDVQTGRWLGFTNKPIKDIVSIGVGGSNLGPEMATQALAHYSKTGLNIHYASNVDGNQIANVLSKVNPETTLFVVSSKTFTTSETMTNANTATKWLVSALGDTKAIANHFVAVSTNTKKVCEFGIDEKNIFDMWDWEGGRFSLW